MKRSLLLTLVMILPVAAGARPLTEAPADLRSLVEAEMGFNEASADSGMRAAFLAHLAEGSVIFRPGPVNGREWMESWPGTEGILSWTPVHAEISRDGTFGFTTGPWEYRSAADQNPAQTGYYLSVWSLTDEGWRVLGDIGTVGPIPDSLAVGEITWPDAPGDAPENPDPEAERDRLMQEDAALSDLVFEGGLDRFFERTTDDVLLFRIQKPLRRGREEAREAIQASIIYPVWEPEGGRVAPSGDMGFTYGLIYPPDRATGKPALEVGSYLRVWRRGDDGRWLVAAEVIIPNSRG